MFSKFEVSVFITKFGGDNQFIIIKTKEKMTEQTYPFANELT